MSYDPMDDSQQLDRFRRKETEILERLGEQREAVISELVRNLVVQTIGEVEMLLDRGSSEPESPFDDRELDRN